MIRKLGENEEKVDKGWKPKQRACGIFGWIFVMAFGMAFIIANFVYFLPLLAMYIGYKFYLHNQKNHETESEPETITTSGKRELHSNEGVIEL